MTAAVSPLPAGAEALFPVLLGQDPESLAELLGGDPAKAALWVWAAADQGLPEAQVRLGQMLLDGVGVARNAEAARNWFGRAAGQGDADGANMVGRCLENGWGGPIDLARAALFYHRAAESGHAWAQYNLGHLLLDGAGVTRDPAEALAWYRRAATQGHARAMSLVGRCLEHGWGAAKDATAAADWYRRSAEGAYFRGQFNWASLLAEQGRTAEASPWFKAALASAPAESRAVMRSMLSRHPASDLRDLAGAWPC